MTEMDEEKVIYRLNDDICFRKCSLFDGKRSSHGNCTCFVENEENWRRVYYCNQNGIHLHCGKHPEVEFETIQEHFDTKLYCPKCRQPVVVDNLNATIQKCLRYLNIEEFKGAKLVRLDDWYVPEVRVKKKTDDYWVSTDVKTDRDGDTIIVLYVGYTGDKQKAQFFIKPEKLQLSSDHKDMDPAKVLSKI